MLSIPTQVRAPQDTRMLFAEALWRRPVLIGDQTTLRTLAVLLENTGIKPAACFDIHAAEGPRVLTTLPTLHTVDPFTIALVCLPRELAAPALQVRTQLRSLGIVERIIPTVTDLLSAPAPARPGANDIDLVELIGRIPYGIDRRAVERVLTGKRVLITGAGGSIGSEICRIVATFRPEQLIMMERSENALFEIDRLIARRFPEVPRRAILHDVVDAEQTLRHLVALKPHAIFHAAAHKHVPLMEDHPSHAVTNNLFGTKSIADAAQAVGAERFVMISSDKAVNPTSVMGATKRLAEMYTQSLACSSTRTSFSMVRFGNVLGSACSVLPIWASQVAEGGPITVTDPRMTRYFMTINEAATLVIQAGAIDIKPGQTPSIFVLDMGAPIRIAELAQRFARLNGFEPRLPGTPFGSGNTVEIAFTGARPGEKIHEELAYAAEALTPTSYAGIMALAGSVHASFDVASMVADFSALRTASDRSAVLAAIRRHVPEMAPGTVPATQSAPVERKIPTSRTRAA